MATTVEDAVFAFVGAVGVFSILVALVNLAKEKFGVALVGLFVVPVGLVGALRLAKPGSLWARFYGTHKRSRAAARFGEPAAPAPRPAPGQSAAGSG